MSRLTHLTLKNWKSFGEARNAIELAPLTLLVGPNASGKSNALDALRFLQGAAMDYPLGDVFRGRWEGQREIWPAIRGQAVEAARVGAGEPSFALETKWLIEDAGGSLTYLDHQIEIDVVDDAWLHGERLIADWGTIELDTHAASLRGSAGRSEGGAIRAALRAGGKGPGHTATYSALRSLLGQVVPEGRALPDVIDHARAVQRAMREVVFLDIHAARMRDYRPEHARALGTSGENVSPVLAGLDEAARADVVDWLGELCAPAIEDIEFDRTQLKEVMFFLREGSDRKISARSVSDGTLRFLGLVTALLTAPAGSILVIEEPDVGLHPARVHLLARLLEQVTRDGRIQIIATTHSPTLLAHLSPEALGDVVALGRDPTDETTVCARLRDLPHFATLRDSEQLDHLVSTGWIERAL